ncbi:hypothetical protein GOBAR_AA03317 [Gossypium barbadense]|uniref:Uncharacterized protein n=2 Tax=Gossypium TaxID=3633 RepID=A0ABR0Q8Y1_GOSAR|nr:hypothetical protein PVK06_011176 [Gossypium arboreum]PPS17265.1 hypothetical protein GOBAR_AA03317 [Gossypium barbadense]
MPFEGAGQLEFLPELFDSLKGEAYSLTEAKAAIFLPCLAAKLGHNIEKVRGKMRELTFLCLKQSSRWRVVEAREEESDSVSALEH